MAPTRLAISGYLRIGRQISANAGLREQPQRHFYVGFLNGGHNMDKPFLNVG